MNKIGVYLAHATLALAVSPLVLASSPPREPAFEQVLHTAYFDMLKRADQALRDKDNPNVFALQQRLACAGSQGSQAALGGLYLTGRGVVEDDITGYSWLKLGSASGVPAQRDLVKKLEAGMTPAQHVLADSKVEKLKAEYGPLATHMGCKQVDAPGSHMKQLVCEPEHVDAEGSLVWLKRCVDPS